jgi:hypothetical protein
MEIIKRKQKDYANGKIYMIRCNTTKHIYIGSTTKRYLSERLGEHNSKYKCWTGGKTNYVASFDIIKNNNYVILLVELYPCKSSDELRMREQYHIELNTDCFNRHKAYVSEAQKKEYGKEYYENNKEHIKEYQENNKDHIKEYRKEYYENNKEQTKKYYENNKEHLNQKHDCICGGKYTTQKLSVHIKTKKHVNSLTQ